MGMRGVPEPVLGRDRLRGVDSGQGKRAVSSPAATIGLCLIILMTGGGVIYPDTGALCMEEILVIRKQKGVFLFRRHLLSWLNCVPGEGYPLYVVRWIRLKGKKGAL